MSKCCFGAGCRRESNVQILPHFVLTGVTQGNRAFGYQRVQTAVWLQRVYGEMLATTRLRRRPQLISVEAAGGAGGIWLPRGVILLAIADCDQIAHTLWWSLASQDAYWLDKLEFLRAFVLTRLLAHEIGHELSYAGFETPYDFDVEAAADYWAGCIDAARNQGNVDLGASVFASIGCNEDGCDHPPSDVRARAYQDGFNYQSRVQAA